MAITARVKRLERMGFSPDQVRVALNRSNQDVNRALVRRGACGSRAEGLAPPRVRMRLDRPAPAHARGAQCVTVALRGGEVGRAVSGGSVEVALRLLTGRRPPRTTQG